MTDVKLKQTAEQGGSPAQTPDNNPAEPETGPYLKIFGGDIGVFEAELRRRIVTIGRSRESDVTLPSRSVSRVHARIINEDGRYTLEDASSTSGTAVNGKPTTTCVLEHEDSIEIGTYVMQFRTQREEADAGGVADRAELLLRGKYRTLPSNIRLRFRVLAEGPALDASSVATLPTEQGGLLIPSPGPPGDASSLELELSTPSGSTGRLLGELTGVVEDGGKHWMCVRTHRLPKRQYEVVIAGTKPGPWQDVCPG